MCPRAVEERGSWGGWSDLLLLLTDRINNMKRIILHFLIMLESIPCLAQRLLLKAARSLLHSTAWIYTNVTFLM